MSKVGNTRIAPNAEKHSIISYFETLAFNPLVEGSIPSHPTNAAKALRGVSHLSSIAKFHEVFPI